MRKPSRNPKKAMLYTLMSCAFLLQLQGNAYATEETEFQLDQVIVTAARVPQTVAATPNNVTVITNQELRNKGARTLADALTGVTGIVVKNYGGTGEPSIAYIWGSDRIVVLVDGKRMNLPQGIGSGSAGVNLNTFLLGDNVERIEVVHGGASVLYGADAVGGVINIITRKTQEPQTTMSAAGGSYGAGYYSLSVSGQEKNTYWQLSGVQETSDGQRSNSAYKGKNGAIRLDQDLSKGEAITFTYDYYDSQAGIPGPLFFPSPASNQDISRHDWSVAYSKVHADGSRTVRYYDNSQIYSGVYYGSRFRHQNTVQSLEYQDNAKLGADNVLTWGVEYRQGKVASTNEQNGLNKDTTRAVYLQDKYRINAASSLAIGLRHDDNNLYGTHLLPQAAYLYEANGNVSYFANWSKVFKAPKFDDLYGDDGYGNTGNPNLKPESGWTAEIGVKGKLSSVTETNISVFKRRLTDAIRWLPDSNSVFHPYNIDSYQATGINLSLTTKMSAVTTADFGYTYLDSSDGNNNNTGESHNTFHVGLNLRNGNVSQSIQGIYQDQSGVKANRIPGNFVVNTHTQFSLDKKTAVYLKVSNLFNRQYQASKGYPANSRTVLLGVRRSL